MSSTPFHAAALPAGIVARPVSFVSGFGCSTPAAPIMGTPNGRGTTMAWTNADLGKRITPGVLGGLT